MNASLFFAKKKKTKPKNRKVRPRDADRGGFLKKGTSCDWLGLKRLAKKRIDVAKRKQHKSQETHSRPREQTEGVQRGGEEKREKAPF